MFDKHWGETVKIFLKLYKIPRNLVDEIYFCHFDCNGLFLIIHDIQDYFKKFYYVDRQTWIGHIPLRFCRWYTWKLYLTSRICFKRTKITMIIWFIFSLDITSTVAVLKPRIPDKLQIYQNWTGIDDGAIRLIYNRSLQGKKLYLITSHFLYIIVK